VTVTLVGPILTADRPVKAVGLVAHDMSRNVCKQTRQSGKQNRHDGLTLEEESTVRASGLGPCFVEHQWIPFLTKFFPEKYTARFFTASEYMNLNIAITLCQCPEIERIREQNRLSCFRTVFIEPGVLRESKTLLVRLIGEVTEVPKNVVQHRIGIAAAAATAAAATSFAARARARASAELL
jgi:hypothetical protein